MAPRLPSSPSACIFCRAMLKSQTSNASSHLLPTTQAARGSTVRNQNRKNSKTDFTFVQLLQPIPAYGEEGAYMSIPRGAMRNQFYPRAQARYVLADELKDLKSRDVKIERDRSFLMAKRVKTESGMDQKPPQGITDAVAAFAENMQRERAKENAMKVKEHEEELRKQATRAAELQRKAEILARALLIMPGIVDSNYIFHRPINTTNAHLDKSGNWKAGTPIFGSITVTDILARLRDSLSKDVDTASLAIDESNVSIKSGADQSEPDRVKSLGIFGVELTIPGSTEVFTTMVQVLPDESSDEALAQAREAARKAAKPAPRKESAGSAFAKRKKRTS